MAISETPVKDSLIVFLEGARANFNVFGHVRPIFGCNIDGEPRLEAIVFQKAADKDAFRQYILDLIGDGHLREFVFVAEAWTATTTEAEEVTSWLAEHKSLEGFPGVAECVQVLYCSAAEEICYTAVINRGNIVPMLGEWSKTTSEGFFGLPQMTSRFQSLFAIGKSGNN